MTTHDELVASGLHECASDCPPAKMTEPQTAAGRELRDALWVYTGNKSAQDAITQRILRIEAEAAAAPAACDLDPDGHCNTHGGKHIEPSAAEPPMRAFWNGDAPRRILVELPPIGKDGRCTGCGKKPSRDTGSCGCHRGVIEHVARYEPAAAEPPNHEHNFVNPANEIVADNGWLVCTICGLLQDPAERPEMVAAVEEQVRLLQEGVPNVHERAAQPPPTYTVVERLDRPGNRADGVRAAQAPPDAGHRFPKHTRPTAECWCIEPPRPPLDFDCWGCQKVYDVTGGRCPAHSPRGGPTPTERDA